MTFTIVPTLPHARGPVISSVQPVKSIHLPWLLAIFSYQYSAHTDDEASVLKRFLHGMGYYAPNIPGTNEKLEAVMRAEMHKHNIQCPQLERTLHLAANLVEVRSSHSSVILVIVLELPMRT